MIIGSNKYAATAVVSLSVWLVANILNAVLFAIVISAGGTGDELSIVGFVLLCSGLFSLPGLFIFWILFLLFSRNINLYRPLLITSAVVSFLSVMLFFIYLSVSFGADRGMWVFVLPVIAAVVSTVVHRKAIQHVAVTQDKIVQSKNSESLET